MQDEPGAGYDIALWALRILFPFAIYTYFFHSYNLKRWAWQVFDALMRAKDHVVELLPGKNGSSWNRSTFRIHENTRDIYSLDEAAQYPPTVSIPRDILLACRPECRSPSRIVELFCRSRLSQGMHTPAYHLVYYVLASSVHAPVLESEAEKQYLQSLLQFRAVKISKLNQASWEKWNEEAQRIIKGAILLKCRGIAAEVYSTLISGGVLPDQETFTLLVRASLVNMEIDSAKFFLGEMVNASFLPPRDLVDSVSNKIQNSIASKPALNKDAPVFVPKVARDHNDDWQVMQPRTARTRE